MRCKHKFVAPFVIGALLLAACSSKPITPSNQKTEGSASQSGAKELTGAGATFPAPLYQQWAAQYKQKFGVQINYQAIGSGGGIQQITAKTVDFGASDAPMKDTELAAAPGVLHIPMVFGGVVVAYNLEGVKGLKLTPASLAGIYLGKLKKWNDPAIAADNPGLKLPSTDIAVVHRSDGSGTTSIFTEYLSKANPEWGGKVGSGKDVAWPAGLGGKGNDGVTALIKQTPGAVGYVELAFATQNSIPFAAIQNSSGAFITPSLKSITEAAAGAKISDDLRFSIVNPPAASAYPISGATWLLVYKDQTDEAKGRALVRFLDWAIHDGQKAAPGLSYAPIPSSLVDAAKSKIKQISFQGKALLK